MPDDASLLREYARDGSDAAFAELVRRHLNLVYSAALRQTHGDRHLAEDIAQTVFSDLARKAATVADRPVLAGWLYLSTHYAATKRVRAEQRRRRREQEAFTMHEPTHESAHDAEWARVRPALDTVMRELGERDRDAILLRFFEDRGFAEIGERLHLSENGARMRVERAMEKLRAQLQRRGIGSTAAALATVLAGHAVTAAPTTLVASVTSTALASAATGGVAAGVLQFMALNKLQAAVAGTVLAGLVSTAVIQQRALADLRQEAAAIADATPALEPIRAEQARLSALADELKSLRADDNVLVSLRRALAQLQAPPPPPRRASTPTPRPVSKRDPEEPIFSVAELDQTPVVKFQAPPTYPFEQRRNGTSGEVVVGFVVDADGVVSDVRPLKSTLPAFEASAVAAVERWTFRPGQKDGVPVNAQMQVPIIFSVGDEWF